MNLLYNLLERMTSHGGVRVLSYFEIFLGLCIVFHSFLNFCQEIIPNAENAKRNNNCNHDKLDESVTMELDEKKTISSDDDRRKADQLTVELQLIGMVTAIIAPCIFINPWRSFT